MTATADAPKRVTAAVLVIGDEILSGRTQDVNLSAIAKFVAAHGVDLAEARVVPDVAEEIVAAIRALKGRYDYLFTTGGIGPTHDDITADCVAEALGVQLLEDAEIIAEMTERYGEPPNAARRRMARIPEGGSKIPNPVSGPPGFQIENVFVLAGVPRVMQGMLQDIGRRLHGGAVVVSRTVRIEGWGEGVIAAPLEQVAKAHPNLSLGSYPYWSPNGPGANLVVRGRDPGEVDETTLELIRVLDASGVSGAVRVED